MRDTFSKRVTELAASRKDIALLSGDIGNRMFDKFKECAPSQFINCGIAEANMVSVAAGLALSGMRPFVYTITPFTTTRVLEQIKIGAGYHEAAMIIVGTGSGLSYAELGATHHSFEDIAILSVIPNMNIFTPADAQELLYHIDSALGSNRPSYIRLGKKGEPCLTSQAANMGLAHANVIREGTDLLVISIGPIASEALIAASLCESKGVSLAVAIPGSLKPLDEDFLHKMSNRFDTWIIHEEHSIIGGAGSIICNWLAENNINVRLVKLAMQDEFIHALGKQQYIRKELGIDSEGLANLALSL